MATKLKQPQTVGEAIALILKSFLNPNYWSSLPSQIGPFIKFMTSFGDRAQDFKNAGKYVNQKNKK